MKTPRINQIIKAFNFKLFLFLLLFIGCEKNEDLLELQIGDNNTIIKKEIDGIEFKFCLLNELDEPGTIFNKGENFRFYFEFKNLSNDEIGFSYTFINDDFFSVKNKDTDFGKSWQSILCQYMGPLPGHYILEKNETHILQIPWIVENNSNIYPFCPSDQKDYLLKGEYYTQFELNFTYKQNEVNKKIDGLKFKINFEIK